MKVIQRKGPRREDMRSLSTLEHRLMSLSKSVSSPKSRPLPRQGKVKSEKGTAKKGCKFIDCYGRDVRPGKNDPSKLTLVHVDITYKPGCGTIGTKFGRFHRNDLKGSPIARMLRELADWAEKQEYGIDDNVQEINVYL